MAGEYTQGVDQVTREAPYIEALKSGQMDAAKALVDAANTRAAGYTPGQFLNPDYEVAGTTTDQANAIAAGRAGIGAFQPYMDTAKQGAIAGQINTINAIQQLKGSDTRDQFIDARKLVNQGASAGTSRDAIASRYGGANAGDVNQASVQGYAADNYGGASAGAARDATSQGYTATDADRIGAIGQTTSYNPALNYYQMGDPSKVSTKSFTDTGTAASYMSPYMQNVVDIQQREAQRQADIAATQQQGAATRSGAFGGGRDAIMRAEAARNLALQKGDIQAQGQQAAYQQAQQQFNAEQGYGLQGQIANQQAGLATGQQNLGANLGVQQLGVQTGLQTSLANLNNLQQASMQTSSQAQQAALQDAAAKNQASQFGAGAANQAQLANAAASNQMAQYNAGNLQQAGMQNAALNTQANRSYSDAFNQAQLSNAAAANQMQQYNAGNQQQAGMQNAALSNQTALANAQAANQMAQYNANASQQAGLGLGSLGTQQFNIGNTMAQGLGSLAAQQGNLSTQYAGLGQAQQALGQQDTNFLYNLGSAQKSQAQAELDAKRQNTLQKNMQPYQQLGFLSDIYSGAPSTQMGTTMTNQAAPSPFQQAASLGIGGITAAAGAKKLGLF